MRGTLADGVTAAQLKKVHTWAKNGLWERDIARLLGYNANYFIELKKQYPELSEAIKRGRAAGHDELAKKLMAQARKGNMTAIIFSLKAQHGWRENEQRETSGDEKPSSESLAERISRRVQEYKGRGRKDDSPEGAV